MFGLEALRLFLSVALESFYFGFFFCVPPFFVFFGGGVGAGQGVVRGEGGVEALDLEKFVFFVEIFF